MEGVTETEIKHCNSHGHPLTLKKNYHPAEDILLYNEDGDFFCRRCHKEILCKASVYTCTTRAYYCTPICFHKNCADLATTFMHPSHTHLLKLTPAKLMFDEFCGVCEYKFSKDYDGLDHAYQCDYSNCKGFKLCLKCAVTHVKDEMTIQHWSHKHRSLRYVERCATFKCDACNQVLPDSSYRCDDSTCPFWIHKTCALLPQSKLFRIHHRHPLWISDSLPLIYREFDQFCKICQRRMQISQWLYYCARCRFFAHIRCALSTTKSRPQVFDEPKLLHLPPPDERSEKMFKQKWIEDMVCLSVDIKVAPPNHINHWAHEHHQLTLKNKSVIISTHQDDLICDGCTEPVSYSDDADVFYECSTCNYCLHRYCAQFPEEIQHEFLGRCKRVQSNVLRSDIQLCQLSNVYSNGFMFESQEWNNKVFNLWWICLPKKIMHVAHPHPLGQYRSVGHRMVYGCGVCLFYIPWHAAMGPVTVNHRWDPHPLKLILSLEDDVDDHPHDFECEYCSTVIDTNKLFYHCNVCDFSLHLDPYCMDPFNRYGPYDHHHHPFKKDPYNTDDPYGRRYTNVKFGATNIKIEAHQHHLTFLLNDKKRLHCQNCGKDTKGHPILQCKLCTYLRHSSTAMCEA